MAFADSYRNQVRLLMRVLPLVAEEKCFALKGGTAINLFVRDMPRLSVDIDLTYLPVQPRAESFAAVDAAMKQIAARITKTISGARTTETKSEGALTRLLVRADGAQIKIEVNPVIRGCVNEPDLRSVSEAVEEQFGFAEIQVVSFPDLYAGKIVAALDRQHPRDLFDVRDLLANEGIDDELRRAFVVYMLSHDRPMAEVLNPTRKDISDEFLRGFQGMTDKAVSKEELVAAREELIAEIVGKMPDAHKRFLLSFERGKSDWTLLDVAGASELPAVKWRMLNLKKRSAERAAEQIAQLEKVLGVQ
jgi:predicted nucleotidyltransferase component of viral defense system